MPPSPRITIASNSSSRSDLSYHRPAPHAVELRPGQRPGAARVRDQPRADARGARAPHRLEHPLVGADAAEQPPHQSLTVRHADPFREARLEVLHLDVAALELAQQPERLGVLTE